MQAISAEGDAKNFYTEARHFTLMVIFGLIAGEKLTYQQAKELNPVAFKWSAGII